MDDWLLIAPSHLQALHNIDFTLSLLENLGLKVNRTKSTLIPSQRVNYIGAILDSRSARAFPPQERAMKRYNAIQQFRPHTLVTAHHALRLLRLMASTTSVIQHAHLKIHSLQAWYLSLFNPISDSPTMLLRVTPELAAQQE